MSGPTFRPPPLPPQSGPPAQPTKPAGSGNGCLFGCLSVVAFFVIIFVLIGVIGGSNGGSPTSDNKYEAIAQCEARVEKLLKAPSTADFSSTATGAGSSWSVTGTVDAENSFGAKLRSSYGCSVTINGDTVTTSIDYFE